FLDFPPRGQSPACRTVDQIPKSLSIGCLRRQNRCSRSSRRVPAKGNSTVLAGHRGRTERRPADRLSERGRCPIIVLMGSNHSENQGFMLWLLRRHQSLGKTPLQFTLQSLLVCMGYFGCLLWMIQFIVRTQPLDIPIVMHLWFLMLWTSAIAGAFI